MERDREGKEEEKIMRVIYKNELFGQPAGRQRPILCDSPSAAVRFCVKFDRWQE